MGYTGVVPLDAIVATIQVSIEKTLCWLLGFWAGRKGQSLLSDFARWLDWCQIGRLSGGSFGGNPCCGNCAFLGETVGSVVSDLTHGGKKKLEILEFLKIC